MSGKIGIEKGIRICTLAPVMALIALTILLFAAPEALGGVGNYLAAVAFLTVLPLLAYPLQPLLPGYRDKGRTGQRNLAIVMAVLGYIFGILFAIFARVPSKLMMIFLVYFLSGAMILALNKGLKVKASGHACGVVGPVTYLFVCIGWPSLLGLAVLALVFWASLRMERHKWSELILGSFIPVLALFCSMWICRVG